MMSVKDENNYGRILSLITIWLLVCIGFVGLSMVSNEVSAAGPTNVSGLISTDTTWTEGNSPYIVTGDITVMAGRTLNIQAGTIVKFANNTNLEIRGLLNVIGTKSKPVIFKSYSSRNISLEEKGVWQGVHIATDLGGKAYIQYSEFYNANSALRVDCCEGNGPVNISDCIFKNNTYAFDGYTDWDIIIERCLFENNTFAITRADKIIRNSIFRNNEYGLYETERISVYDSMFTGNKVALYGGRGVLQGCQIYNNNISIQAFFEGFKMTNNNITNNVVGIVINDYDSYIPLIRFNNIFNNSQYNLKTNSKYDSDVKHNWWGTTNITIIDQYIYDIYDNMKLGEVVYKPFLTSPATITSSLLAADAGPDQNLTVGQTVYFDGSDSYIPEGQNITYNWDFGDGTSTGWQNYNYNLNTSHTYNKKGNYTVTLTLRDGKSSDSDTCLIIVSGSGKNNPPVAIISSSKTVYKKDEKVNLYGHESYDPDGDELIFRWYSDIHGLLASNINLVNITLSTGTHEITLEVNDGSYKVFKNITIIVTSGDADSGDLDGDGLPDDWELIYFGSIELWGKDDDPDADGFSNYQEWQNMTDPTKASTSTDPNDTDGDSYPDKSDTFPTDPTQWQDSDGDGFGDNQAGNNPDQFPYDPTEWSDIDRDGVGDNSDAYPYDPDHREVIIKDSDGDGISDTWEKSYGLNPNDQNDSLLDLDNDLLTNLEEYNKGTNPKNWDTDNDGYNDKIDAFPTDFERYITEPEREGLSWNNLIMILIVIIIVLVLIILKLSIIVFKRKHERIEKPRGNDILFRKVIQEVLSTDSDNDLTPEEFNNILERKFQNGEMSPGTYHYMKNFIQTQDKRKF